LLIGRELHVILWLKVLHIVAVISWMAGLLYLPRLFVYHAEAGAGSPQSATFKVMQFRLLTYIMRPAMIVVWLTGPMLAWLMGYHKDIWFLLKMLLVVLLTVAHVQMLVWHREFDQDRSVRTSTFFRVANEVPTVLMILIVALVVVKPF
jgi:protoporphyrinogen IX oxidase